MVNMNAVIMNSYFAIILSVLVVINFVTLNWTNRKIFATLSNALKIQNLFSTHRSVAFSFSEVFSSIKN